MMVAAAGSLAATQVMSPPAASSGRSPSATPVVVDPDAKPMPAGTSLIVGRVMEAGGPIPVSGAVVTLSLKGAQPRQVIADAQGRFVFRDLPNGTFDLVAARAGYLPGAFGRVRPGGPFQSISLADDERRPDVTISLWRHGVVTGMVVDESNEPLVGASLQVLERQVIAGAKRLSPGPTGTTDDRGIYRIWGLLPGDYVVALPMTKRPEVVPTLDPEVGAASAVAVAPAAAAVAGTSAYPALFYLQAASASRALVVPVGSGDEKLGIDFAVRPARVVTVAGTLSGPDGPAGRVPITLFPAEATELTSSIETAVTTTDAAGAFSFRDVPPGQYTLRAVKFTTAADLAAPGALLSAVDRMMPLAGAPVLWAEAPIAVVESDVTDVAAALRPGLHVSGRVEFIGAKPPARELASLEAFLSPADGRIAALPSRGPIGADGKFSTVGLLPGRYVVMTVGLPRGWSLEHAMVNGRDVSDAPLEIESEDVTGLVLTFTDQPTQVTGFVTDADGHADRNASVIVFPTDSSRWVGPASTLRRMRRVRVTEAGAYSVVNLPAGSYFAAAVGDDVAAAWSDPAFLATLAQSATRIEIGAGDRKSQDLRTKHVARGTQHPARGTAHEARRTKHVSSGRAIMTAHATSPCRPSTRVRGADAWRVVHAGQRAGIRPGLSLQNARNRTLPNSLPPG